MSHHTGQSGAARYTAARVLGQGQKRLAIALVLVVAAGLILSLHGTLVALVACALLFYVLFVGLKLALHVAARRYAAPAVEPVSVDDPDLPTYTLFVPLYREANMLRSLVRSLNGLVYPKERLQVLLLLEHDDDETRAEVIGLDLPPWFETVVVPDLPPKGKPKALNMGLAQATGAFCVIYDAEDRPDPDQLLKAVAAFRAAPEDVACLQARLFFWNEDSSWITRFYWAEYIVHFERVLPGFAKLGLIPPLGGTSNHFRTDALRDVAFKQDALPVGAEGVGAWDPWNVTEDAELAGALALHGYRVLIFDSATGEEATARPKIADRQRRRWLKGYLQTGLAFTRAPLQTAKQMGAWKWFCYTLLMLGTPLSLTLNPIFWALTIAYFVTRSPAIESLFPPLLFYVGIILLVAGNLLLFYQLVGACLLRKGYGSVRYLLLTPAWWAFTSYSAYGMLWELARPATRHVWNKTPHGHDLDKEPQGKRTMTGVQPRNL